MRRRLSPATLVVAHAAGEVALSMGHQQIDTGHLLAGLVQVPGPVAAALASRGVDPVKVHECLADRPGRVKDGLTEAGHVPFTAEARQVLTWAHEIAADHGRTLAGPGALFLALVREPTGQAVAILTASGQSPDSIRMLAQQLADDEG